MGAMRSPPGRERRAAVAAAVQQALAEERAAQEARNARVLDILRDKDDAIAQSHAKQDALQTEARLISVPLHSSCWTSALLLAAAAIAYAYGLDWLQVRELSAELQHERAQHAALVSQARQTEDALREALSAAHGEAQQLRDDCGLKESALLDEVTRLRQEVRDARRTGKTSEALAEEVRALEADLQRARDELARADQGRQASGREADDLKGALAATQREAAVRTSTLSMVHASSCCPDAGVRDRFGCNCHDLAAGGGEASVGSVCGDGRRFCKASCLLPGTGCDIRRARLVSPAEPRGGAGGAGFPSDSQSRAREPRCGFGWRAPCDAAAHATARSRERRARARSGGGTHAGHPRSSTTAVPARLGRAPAAGKVGPRGARCAAGQIACGAGDLARAGKLAQILGWIHICTRCWETLDAAVHSCPCVLGGSSSKLLSCAELMSFAEDIMCADAHERRRSAERHASAAAA